MYIKHLELENFTVLHELNMDFSRGINVFIGENGMGKTHIMKALYSACQAVKPDVSFSQKLVRVALTVLAFIACSVVRIAVGVHVSR